jgi:hypothetical protein
VGFVVALATLCSLTSLAQLSPSAARLHVLVHDESDQPISGADVQLKRQDMVMTTGTTNQKGETEFAELGSGTYELMVTKAEFQALKQDVLVKAGPPVEIEFILSPRLAAKEEVLVEATPDSPLEQSASPGAELERDQLKELPGKPATVTDGEQACSSGHPMAGRSPLWERAK